MTQVQEDFEVPTSEETLQRVAEWMRDRQTQAREIRKLISGPDFMLGSVNAVTEDGVLVASSASASQLGPYASTAAG